MNTPYFDGIKVGDKIWTIRNGWTEVEDTSKEFRSKPAQFHAGTHWYDLHGVEINDKHQSAFWTDPKIVAPERPTPKTLDEEFEEMWANDPKYCNDLESKTRRTLRWILHKAVSEARK